MTGRLAGKSAIVTGAGGAIGRAIALALAREGARLLVSDISGREQEVAREIGGEAFALSCDVGDPAQVQAMVDACVERFGGVDIACSNAGGGGELKLLVDTTEEEYEAVQRLNLKGYFNMLQKCIRRMAQQSSGGVIVATSSLTALRASPNCSPYAAAKAGIVALTRAATVENAMHNIRVNAVLPGIVESAMTARLSQEFRKSLAAQIPMGRVGMPEDVASVVLFLASDDARYVNGQGIVVDGGRSAG